MPLKHALVTGGTSGVGRSLVEALAEAGHAVTFIGRDQVRGDAVVSYLKLAHPSAPVSFVPLDLAVPEAVESFARSWTQRGPQLSLLANVAGALSPRLVFGASGVEMNFGVSCLAAIQLTERLLPLLQRTDEARILNVGASPRLIFEPRLDLEQLERTGRLARVGLPAKRYSAFRSSALAVHAQVVLAQCFAERLAGSSVTVNAFHPGNVRSELFRAMPAPARWAMRLAQPLFTKQSKAAARAALSAELRGQSGTLVLADATLALPFEREYCQALWDVCRRLLARCP